MSATARASEDYPSVALSTGQLLHVCQMGGEWEVWINCEDADFTGLCVAVGATRDDAVRDAVAVFEAAEAELQQPPPQERPSRANETA